MGNGFLSPARLTEAQARRLAQSGRSSPLSLPADKADSPLSKASQRRHAHAKEVCDEEARLLTGGDVSSLCKKVYEHLKAQRTQPDNEDYRPKAMDDAARKRNPHYSSLDSLKRSPEEKKLGVAGKAGGGSVQMVPTSAARPSIRK